MIDGLIEFILELDTWQLIGYFWPFFAIDLIRYVILDLVVIPVHIFNRWRDKNKFQQARKSLYHEMPLVSVIAPGKNEGRHIRKLADSLARQTYKRFETIIVDDGSDDDTPKIGRQLEREGVIDLFVRNEIRGGKASAANTALYFCKGKFIVHLDADSYLAHDSIEKALLHFYLDPEVGAVGGDVRVANQNASFSTRTQAIEYMKSISTGRTGASLLGVLRIVAGAYGVFRKDTLQRIKGWDVGPGLDGDITVKIRKIGYKIIHEPHAICYTNVPTTFKALAKQRYRWDRSLIRFRLRKHIDVFLPSANFRIKNFLSFSDNVVFNFLLNFKWWIYLVQILVFHADVIEYIIMINYILYLLANIIEFVIACWLYSNTLQRRDILLIPFLPLMPIYTSLYLRIIRTIAQLMELFHYASYRDKWNPWKVSSVAEKEKL